MKKSWVAIAGALLVLVPALGLGLSRTSLSNKQRTTQEGLIYSSPKPNDGFAFKILQHPNMGHKHPTSAMVAWVYPHASGAFKNRSGSPPLHTHAYDDEEFEVKEGELGYILNGKEGVLKAGGRKYLPGSVSHTFWNNKPDTTLVFQVTIINKSGKFSAGVKFFEQWAGIAYDYGGIDNVNPLQLILALHEFGIHIDMPAPLHFLVVHAVCPLAQLLGFKGQYLEYQQVSPP